METVVYVVWDCYDFAGIFSSRHKAEKYVEKQRSLFFNSECYSPDDDAPAFNITEIVVDEKCEL